MDCKLCGADISGRDMKDILLDVGYVCHKCFDKRLIEDGYLDGVE